MSITDEKLKAAIQIALGTHGLYTEKIESDLIYHIKALSIPIVVKSLPTIKERNNELIEMLENYYEDEEAELKKEFKFGFKHCFKWMHDKMSV